MVCRFVRGNDRDRPAHALLFQVLAERLRKITHFVRVENALAVDPVEDLLAPIRWLSPGNDALFPFGGQARDGVRRGGQAIGGELHDPERCQS